jgi:tetratricopeptide (TPR) repeat protein
MYVNSDRFENAISSLRNAKSLFPKRQNVRRLLSTAYAGLKLFDVAISELRSFWKDGTAEADTYSMLGSLFDWIGDETNALAVMSEAYKRFPHNLLVVNNLAYVHLVIGEVNEARTVLASLPRHSQATVELVATRGLLHLLEGDRKGGVRLYGKAEEMARESGRRELATRVRQRMYLESARLAAKNGDLTNALSEAKRGLKLKPNRYSCQPQLEELIAGIEERGRQML